jgi:hypothetical protein
VTPAIGWCAPLERAADLAAAGLDYHELQLVPMKLEDDAAFAAAKARVRDLPLPVPVMSYLFPHDLRLVGDVVHEARARAYFDRVVELMAAAGHATCPKASMRSAPKTSSCTRCAGAPMRWPASAARW